MFNHRKWISHRVAIRFIAWLDESAELFLSPADEHGCEKNNADNKT
jgi:hypothetical protein